MEALDSKLVTGHTSAAWYADELEAIQICGGEDNPVCQALKEENYPDGEGEGDSRRLYQVWARCKETNTFL